MHLEFAFISPNFDHRTPFIRPHQFTFTIHFWRKSFAELVRENCKQIPAFSGQCFWINDDKLWYFRAAQNLKQSGTDGGEC